MLVGVTHKCHRSFSWSRVVSHGNEMASVPQAAGGRSVGWQSKVVNLLNFNFQLIKSDPFYRE